MKRINKHLSKLVFALPLLLTTSCSSFIDSIKENLWIGKLTCDVFFFNFNGELLYVDREIEIGQDATYKGDVPTRDGDEEYTYYAFAGWDKELTNIQYSINVYATFNGFNSKEEYEEYEKGLKGEDFASGPLALEHTSYDINTSQITAFEDENYFYYLTKSDTYSNISDDSFKNSIYYSSDHGYKTYTYERKIVHKNQVGALVAAMIKEKQEYSFDISNFILFDENHIDPVSFSNPLEIDKGYTYVMDYSKNYYFEDSKEDVEDYSTSAWMQNKRVTFTSHDLSGYYTQSLYFDVDVYVVIIKSKVNGDLLLYPQYHIYNPTYQYFFSENEADLTTNIEENEVNLDAYLTRINDVGHIDYVGKLDGNRNIFVSSAYELLRALGNSKAKIYLENDIDLAGNYVHVSYFEGLLDGNGYSLKNISSIGHHDGVNLFGGIFTNLNGTIRNLTIDNAKFVLNRNSGASRIQAGILASYTSSKAEIDKVKIENSMLDTDLATSETSGKFYSYVGGFVGRLQYGTISNCVLNNSAITNYTNIHTNTSSTADCWSYVGGIVGELYGGTVKSCTRRDDSQVDAATQIGSKTSASHCHAGGIVGYYTAGNILGENVSSLNNVDYHAIYVNGKKANSCSANKGAIKGN